MLTVDSRGRNPRGHIEVRLVDTADLNGELPLGAVVTGDRRPGLRALNEISDDSV